MHRLKLITSNNAPEKNNCKKIRIEDKILEERNIRALKII